MMTVNIICVGKLKEAYWRDACAEYSKRLSAFCKFSIIELDEARLSSSPSESEIKKALDDEGEKILAKCAGGKIIAMCIEGKEMPSEKLAQRISECSVQGFSNVVFIIGGSHGLSDEVKRRADFKLSMSEMTFPHQLARVMLCEQIYRALSINAGTKYHK